MMKKSKLIKTLISVFTLALIMTFIPAQTFASEKVMETYSVTLEDGTILYVDIGGTIKIPSMTRGMNHTAYNTYTLRNGSSLMCKVEVRADYYVLGDYSGLNDVTASIIEHGSGYESEIDSIDVSNHEASIDVWNLKTSEGRWYPITLYVTIEDGQSIPRFK